MSVAESRLEVPGKGRGLLDVFSHRYLLSLVVKKEMRVRYRGSVLGLAWSYVKPAVQFIVFYFAMGIFLGMNKSIPKFPVYLFSGIVVINFFTEAFGNVTRCLVWNSALIKKIYLPRELFPVASIWVAMIHFFPQLVVLLIGAIAMGWHPTWMSLCAAILGFFIIAMLALGLGLMFAAFNVFYRDSENLVDLFLLVATWFSPVLYPLTNVVSALQLTSVHWLIQVYQLNPITVSVELFHYAFWGPTVPGDYPANMTAVTLIGVAMVTALVVVGQLLFRHFEGRFAQEL